MAEYAYTRDLDGGTGDVKFNASAETWSEGQPMTVAALTTLRTPKGRCLVDPDLGVDWDRVDALSQNAAATGRRIILDAFKRYVDAGLVRDVTADVEVDPSLGRLLYSVSFYDVRERQRVEAVTGSAP